MFVDEGSEWNGELKKWNDGGESTMCSIRDEWKLYLIHCVDWICG